MLKNFSSPLTVPLIFFSWYYNLNTLDIIFYEDHTLWFLSLRNIIQLMFLPPLSSNNFHTSSVLFLFVLSVRPLYIHVQNIQNYSVVYFNLNAFRQGRGGKNNPQWPQWARTEFNKLFPIKKICIKGKGYKHYNSHITRKVRNVKNLQPCRSYFKSKLHCVWVL